MIGYLRWISIGVVKQPLFWATVLMILGLWSQMFAVMITGIAMAGAITLYHAYRVTRAEYDHRRQEIFDNLKKGARDGH